MPSLHAPQQPLQALLSEYLHVCPVAVLERQVIGCNEHACVTPDTRETAMAITRQHLGNRCDYRFADPRWQALELSGLIVAKIAIVAPEDFIAADPGQDHLNVALRKL